MHMEMHTGVPSKAMAKSSPRRLTFEMAFER
jgi:hypothetical protein